MKVGELHILNYMYKPIADALDGKIDGGVYIKQRPADSMSEDALIVLQDVTSEQVQEGIGRINIFTNDVEYKGSYYYNHTRLAEYEELVPNLIDELNGYGTDYLFELAKAPSVIKVPDQQQHFVTIPIRFRRITF